MDQHDREKLRAIAEGMQAETWRLRGRTEAMADVFKSAAMLAGSFQKGGTVA